MSWWCSRPYDGVQVTLDLEGIAAKADRSGLVLVLETRVTDC